MDLDELTQPRKQSAENHGVMSTPDETVFAFEKLDVYRCATEFLATAAHIITGLPIGYSALADQLKRAALSTPVNVAEGVGRTSPADSRRHYAIARGSAMECAAILDACRVLGVADDSLVAQGRTQLVRIVRMLSKMCR